MFETRGEEAVLRFAEEHIEPMIYENGPKDIGRQEYNNWKTQMVGLQLEEKTKLDRGIWIDRSNIS